MSLKPYYLIAGQPPKPQFLLKDYAGREYGVVEHYETDAKRSGGHALLEFWVPDSAAGEPAAASRGRPMIWIDLNAWTILAGHGKNLPDADFEAGLQAYLQSWSESERDLRRDRARQALRYDLIKLAEQGYSVAYQEMFPGELLREDFPSVRIGRKPYIVDDQYQIQPGDFRNQVTLVFVPDAPESRDPQSPALLCNWLFDEGYEILQTALDEGQCHKAIAALVENKELEKIYKERLAKMRREGVILGVKPKPYEPRSGRSEGEGGDAGSKGKKPSGDGRGESGGGEKDRP